MKKIVISLFTMFFVTTIGNSQSDNAAIDVIQAVFGVNKRLIMEEHMELNDTEKKSFWRIYDQYEEKRKGIEKEGFLLLKEYADKYRALNDAEAHRLIVSFMTSMDRYNNLHKVYFRKMEKCIGGLKAAKFIQLEAFIQTTSQANLQSQVPVIGELERLDRRNTERNPDEGKEYPGN